MSEELVHFVAEETVRNAIEAAFQQHRRNLLQRLPAVDIQHVGGTSVPGCLTKGDLDIQVRVPPSAFAEAERVLAQHYSRNEGSIRTGDFASFKDDAASPPLGIQLTASGGRFDMFCKLRDVLRARPNLLEQFNALKRRHEGRSMESYRAAKAAFIEAILQSDPIQQHP